MSYLERQIPPLEPQVGRDVLVDGPSEFVVELPGDSTHKNGSQSDYTRASKKEPVKLRPDILVDLSGTAFFRSDEGVNGLFDLGDLHTGVDHHAYIVKTKSDDLNSVLRAQRIVYQNQLIQETKDEQSQVGRDRVRSTCAFGEFVEVDFELCEDVALDRESNDSLEEGYERKGPGPGRIW